VLDAWTLNFPGTRPSQWHRWSAEQVGEGEATWQALDRLKAWLPGERSRAVALAGRLEKGREVVETPTHPDWDHRGRSKQRP
jgi:hypothetical protein